MLAEERRQKIYRLIEEEGSARVSRLSEVFKVTENTIRVDLDFLEKDNLIVKKHGGAVLANVSQKVRQLSLQHCENMDLKERIALKAAEFVENGETIIIDSGTTTTELARKLIHKHNLIVITNSLNIALIIGGETSFELHVTGGEFKAPTLSLTGDRAAMFFSNLHASKLFLATGGIAEGGGLTYPGLNDIPVKKAMLESAKDVYLLADSTKIGKNAFAAIPDAMQYVDYLITDQMVVDPEKYGLTEDRIIIAD